LDINTNALALQLHIDIFSARRTRAKRLTWTGTVMSLQHLDSAPKADDFTPLSEHQSQTPASFFGAKPVLHAHYEGMTLVTAADQLKQDVAFSNFSSKREGEEDLVEGVEVWVSSE
jgi:nucleotide-sensitive chloride channel 1A